MADAKSDKTKLIRMRVSPRLFDYLGMLSRTTLLGASENDVAEYLLTECLKAMLSERYHEKGKVPD